MNPDLKETLTIWDMQLVSYGSKIIERRKLFVEQLNEIGDDLRIRLRGEGLALVLQHFLQLLIVFNDTVVHHHNLAACGGVGMAVGVGRGAVGCPAGVPDADDAGNICAAVHHLAQIRKPALGFKDRQLMVCLLYTSRCV